VSFNLFNRNRNKQKEVLQTVFPTIEVSLDDVRKAIRKFSEKLPKGAYRTILLNDDYSIDFAPLVKYLGGIPSKKFYMSRETYELFEEHEEMIPRTMDKIQRMIDFYFQEYQKYPVLPFDPDRRVNYFELLQKHFIFSFPEIDFYITDYDGIITHRKPESI
jgi:hypothetical protein